MKCNITKNNIKFIFDSPLKREGPGCVLTVRDYGRARRGESFVERTGLSLVRELSRGLSPRPLEILCGEGTEVRVHCQGESPREVPARYEEAGRGFWEGECFQKSRR